MNLHVLQSCCIALTSRLLILTGLLGAKTAVQVRLAVLQCSETLSISEMIVELLS